MSRAVFLTLLLVWMSSTGWKSQDSAKTAPASRLAIPSGLMMAENRNHPLAKYLELAGFRLSEKKQGQLTVQFAVVNHSDANITDLGMNISLKPTTAGPNDPPFCTFSVKVPSLAPVEAKDTTAECKTTLRIYELPDWMFIRPTFQITSPSM
jgi:hypothetical protein